MTIKATFGEGKDKVTMTDQGESIVQYIEYLKKCGWIIEDLTKIEIVTEDSSE